MYIAKINSTNDFLKEHPEVNSVRTDYQTAGRGQMGNGWESENGQNVLLSVRLNPEDLSAQDQWQVCIMASVALWQTVAQYIDHADKLCIKWPNDLYYGDQKLAGMLIEHTLCGNKIGNSIIGIGLNVNQQRWIGNAPNPTSIRNIAGQINDVAEIAHLLEQNLRNMDETFANEQYRQHLYRKNGFFWWEERAVDTSPTMNGQRTNQSFEAEIAEITQQGELVLRKKNGEEKKYHFKQIKYIL